MQECEGGLLGGRSRAKSDYQLLCIVRVCHPQLPAKKAISPLEGLVCLGQHKLDRTGHREKLPAGQLAAAAADRMAVAPLVRGFSLFVRTLALLHSFRASLTFNWAIRPGAAALCPPPLFFLLCRAKWNDQIARGRESAALGGAPSACWSGHHRQQGVQNEISPTSLPALL